MQPLQGVSIVSLASNLPGPVAAARLTGWGARVTKVEPPAGDPLCQAAPAWYKHLTRGQEVIRLDLKTSEARERLHGLLPATDVLLTSSRPRALHRLGLDWAELRRRLPRLCHIAIVGDRDGDADRPGHDLTYQARAGLISPPGLPRSLLADLAGAERAVSAVLAALLSRGRDGQGRYAQIALAAVAEAFAEPLKRGLTAPDGLLGGGFPGYNPYPAQDGWVAVAALETHFWERLKQELGLTAGTQAELENVFATRTATAWEAWAATRGLPLAAVAVPANVERQPGSD